MTTTGVASDGDFGIITTLGTHYILYTVEPL